MNYFAIPFPTSQLLRPALTLKRAIYVLELYYVTGLQDLLYKLYHHSEPLFQIIIVLLHPRGPELPLLLFFLLLTRRENRDGAFATDGICLVGTREVDIPSQSIFEDYVVGGEGGVDLAFEQSSWLFEVGGGVAAEEDGEVGAPVELAGLQDHIVRGRNWQTVGDGRRCQRRAFLD